MSEPSQRSHYIYMDHHATTPVDPRVLREMLPYFTERYGNPAGRNHAFGLEAEEAVEAARGRLAHLIGARTKEIIFTSGATESDNLAIRGVASFYEGKGDHIITSAVEHKAVLDTCKELERKGARITILPVDRDGLVDPEQVRNAITDRTILISIIFANNEIGTIQLVEKIGRIAAEKEVFFHTDATQAVGKIPVDVDFMHMDLLSFSAHKMYGPKGVGALFVRARNPRVRLHPILYGGGHERGLRSGTLNVPGIVGFGMACLIAEEVMEEEGERLLHLRTRLRNTLFRELDQVYLNGPWTGRLQGNLNLSFAQVAGESLLTGLRGIAVSSGSACTSAIPEPSYVLQAIGVPEDLARSSIRFGLGRFNTREEVDIVADEVIRAVRSLREMSSPYEPVTKTA
ncbi:MAG: IscS subfamily cysteine desulfurase [Armatimonadetes bacterium]|nr:IscS subfamily cysteine desulfurase [Armatimonadota bacterium]